MQKDIAVVGMACRFAGANSIEEFWENALGGIQSFSDFPRDRWNHELFHSERSRALDKTYVKKGAFIDDVDKFPALEFGIAPKRVEVMDPQHRLALEVTREAIQDASLFRDDFDPAKVGTFLGVVTSEYRNLTTARSQATLLASGDLGDANNQAISDAVKNAIPISAFTMPGTLLNMNAANIARQWGFSGPAFTVDAACTSSLVAIHDAITHIRAGSCTTAIAGGVYLNLTPESLVGFSRIGAISRSGDCRPFDEEADGFLQGDGCGIVVLKKLEDAQRDGDRIYCVIRGAATNNDAGRSAGPMAPSKEGQYEVLQKAYADAQVDPHSIGFVSCHGTATPVGDPVEVGALVELLERHKSTLEKEHDIYLSSIKANIGHTMGAAGVAGFIHATLALFHKKITPQAGFSTLHPSLDLGTSPFQIASEAKEWTSESVRRAGVSAFGFGGTNCHLVIEEFPEVAQLESTPQKADAELDFHTILISASTQELLALHATKMADAIENNKASFDIIRKTLNEGRAIENARLAIVANHKEKLVEELKNAANILNSTNNPGRLSADAFWGIKDNDAKIAFMFPGQGAQRVGLFSDLFQTQDVFRTNLLSFDKTIQKHCNASIEELLYPENPNDSHSDRLRQTEVCQPVMAAIGLALNALLESYGIQADVYFGHSLGEFVACGAADLVSPHEIVDFVAKRGKLMANLKGDHGTMAAIMAPEEEVSPFLVEGVVIANLNHPTQTVISGTWEGIERVLSAVESANLRAIPLRVSHAFHSPIVENISDGLRKAAEKLTTKAGNKKIKSSITTQNYDTNIVENFVEHATSRVDFLGTLLAARGEGINTFIELGAGTTLTSFAQGSLERKEISSFSLGDKKPNQGRSFARALAQMVCAGIDVKFTNSTKSVTSLPPSPLERKRYWAWRERESNLDLPDVLSLKKGNKAMSTTTKNLSTHQPSADLISLFREQANILKQHADILAAQTAALGLSVPAFSTIVLPAVPAPQLSPLVNSAPISSLDGLTPNGAQTQSTPASVDYENIVYHAVEEVSAFPLASLKVSQNLVSDLGFDSLMFVDLVSELQNQIPGLVVTQGAFDQKTKIEDVIHYLEGVEESHTLVDLDAYPIRRYTRTFTPLPQTSWTYIAAPNKVGIIGDVTLAAHFWKLFAKTKVLDWKRKSKEDFIIFSISSLGPLKDITNRLISAFKANRHAQTIIVVCDTKDTANANAIASFVKSMHFERESKCGTIFIDDHSIPKIAFAEHGFPLVKSVKGKLFVETREVAQHTHTPRIVPTDTVLITGGTGALGSLIAKTIIEKIGASVILCGRRDEKDLGNLLNDLGSKASYISWDIGTPSKDILNMVNAVVHCAGVTNDKTLDTLQPKDIDLIFNPKVKGLQNVVQACPNMKSLINFSSWASQFGNAGQTLYAAANGWLDGFQSDDINSVSICWPIWQGDGMGAKLSSAMKDQLRASGVTLLSTNEGVALFLEEVLHPSKGELVIIGRGLTKTVGSPRVEKNISTQSHPFIADHVINEEPILPFASALDWMVEVSTAGRQFSAVQVTGMTLVKGIKASQKASRLHLETTANLASTQAHLHQGTDLSYRAFIGEFSPEVHDLPTIAKVVLDDDIVMDVSEFYAKHSFHGPRIQAIQKVEGVGKAAVIGYVKTSTPKDWIPDSASTSWSVDPMVVDGALQLVLYFLKSKHNKAAYPISFDRYVQLRPFSGGIKCTLALLENNDELVVGSIYFEDKNGLCAWMENLTARVFEESVQKGKALSTPVIVPKIATLSDEMHIDEQHYIISKFPEVEELAQRLEMAELIGLKNPYFRPHTGPARGIAIVDGKEMYNFSSYNYLGFSGHRTVTQQIKDAVDAYGSSASASRVASGQIPIHAELEAELASVVGTESALVFSAGHMTNETVIGHIFGSKDLIIHDSLAHNSILTGAELSGAKRMAFPHSDADALEKILKQLRGNYEKVGIFIEGVYSMDGDIPDLPRFLALKKKYKALLYVDEAHSIGVIGKTGGGLSEYWNVDAKEVDVWMGTLSKAFASCGGYVAASSALVEYLKYTAPAFVFSAGISPANTAAALAAIREMKANPQTVAALQDNCRYFLKALNDEGLDTGMSKDSAVIPVIIGNSMQSLQLAAALSDRGINVQPIFYPAVDDSESRLRFFLSSTHTKEQLDYTAKTVAEELALIRSDAAAE